MSGKHTPGLWEIKQHKDANGFIEISDIGPIRLAEYQEVSKANAQLISASPELLAACEAMIYAFDNDAPEYDDVQTMREAIKKAKGEL